MQERGILATGPDSYSSKPKKNAPSWVRFSLGSQVIKDDFQVMRIMLMRFAFGGKGERQSGKYFQMTFAII